MTLGEMLKDFYRLSRLTAEYRSIVQLIRPQLLGYLSRLQHRHPLVWVTVVGEAFSCDGRVVMGLPATARNAIGPWPAEHAVVARCCFTSALSDQSLLVVYRVVDAPDTEAIDAPARQSSGLSP